MKKHFISFVTVLGMTALLILPFFVFAQGDPAITNTTAETTSNKSLDMLDKIATGGGYQEASIPSVAGLVVRSALSILGVIFIILMVVAGYKWLSAGGDEKEVETAKNYIKRAIIGLIITISSWAIWSFIAERLIG